MPFFFSGFKNDFKLFRPKTFTLRYLKHIAELNFGTARKKVFFFANLACIHNFHYLHGKMTNLKLINFLWNQTVFGRESCLLQNIMYTSFYRQKILD